MEKNNFSDSVDPAARKISDDIFSRIYKDLSLDGFLDKASAILLDTEFLVSRRKIPDLSAFIGRDAVIIGPAKLDGARLKIRDSDIVIVSGSAVENFVSERQPDFIVTDLGPTSLSPVIKAISTSSPSFKFIASSRLSLNFLSLEPAFASCTLFTNSAFAKSTPP